MDTVGTVYLVGAGPGDPDLLTVKALRLLTSAEAVVYDRLVSPEIMSLIPASTRLVPVGKEVGKHCVPQEQINGLLKELSHEYQSVVRLKGGDPFIFGRGSEEALSLTEANIPFEVIPGITAAAACTAYSGIPLTHRRISRSVQFLTGHLAENMELELNWDKIADPETTLVIYMGLSNLEAIAQRLIAAGLSPETPAAAIENGTTPRHRQITSQLQRLSADVSSAQMEAPVLVVIGRVIDLADTLGHWFAPKENHTPAIDAFRAAASR